MDDSDVISKLLEKFEYQKRNCWRIAVTRLREFLRPCVVLFFLSILTLELDFQMKLSS